MDNLIASNAQNPITADVLVTVVCAAVVAFYAAKRYNTPQTNRLSTTRMLFFFSGAGYVGASLLLFLSLCEIVRRPDLLAWFGDPVAGAEKNASAPPVLAAMILTTLLPNTPIVSLFDEWLLKQFQTWGSIPLGVRNLAEALTQKLLPPEKSDLCELRDWIHNEADTPNELADRVSDEAVTTSRGSLTRALRFYQALDRLREAPAYAAMLRERNDDWQSINEEFRVFVAQSQAFFVLFDQLTKVEGAAGELALKRARDCYRNICEKQYGRLAEFLAQLLLAAEGSDQRIAARLQSVKFPIGAPPCPPLPIGPLVFMGVVMIIGILGVAAVQRSPRSPEALPLFINAILIGTTKTIGVVAAILPKLRSTGFRPDRRGDLPYLGWLASAAAATVISLVIERAALAVYFGRSAALDFAAHPLTPIAPTTFAICLSIAVICDLDLQLPNGLVRRIAEGTLCGAMMLGSLFLCTHLLDIASVTGPQTTPWFPYAFSFALGFIGGFVAPALYRRQFAEEPQPGIAATMAHAAT